MANENIVFAFENVICKTGEVGGNKDAVVAIDFTFTATQGENKLSNRTLFRYDQPVYTSVAPFLTFDEWKAQKLYPLLDALVEAYKWKTDLINRLNQLTVDQSLADKPIDEPKAS